MKNFKLSTLIFCGFVFLGTLHASNADSIFLSKAQMYEDFDQFVKIIQTHSAQQKVRKMVTGYDICENLKAQRPNIENISSYWDFIHLMHGQLYRVLDIHSKTMDQNMTTNPYFSYVLDMPDFDTSAISKVFGGYKEFYRTSPHCGKTRFNPLLYNEGKYYLNGNYRVFLNRPKRKGERDSLQFGLAELIRVNNGLADQVVNIGNIAPNKVRWDFKRRKYYTSSWITSFGKVCEVRDLKTQEQFIFPLDSIGIRMSGTSLPPDTLSILHKKAVELKINRDERVSYYDSLGLLYIYVPQMNPQNHALIDSIKAKGREKTIQKIIIDVRGNTGGSDLAWFNILSAITRDSLPHYTTIAMNYHPEVKEYLQKTNRLEYCAVKKVDIMGDTMFTLSTEFYLRPDSNSVGYSGKIYLLQDEDVYSSGHSFTSYARHIPQLVSVGIPTGNIAGFGIDPWVFQLKHSKFTFLVEAAIDITNVEKMEDIFQDIPEVFIYPTLEERVEMDNYKILRGSDEFLFHHDYLFKKVLDLK